MVAWCVENVLHRAQISYGVCVDPELEEHVEVLMGYELRWRYCKG